MHAASAAFKKALIERALGVELGHHLGYAAGAVRPEDATNHRNGKSGKTVREIQGFLAEQYGTEVSSHQFRDRCGDGRDDDLAGPPL